MKRAEQLIETYRLVRHPEGGWFAEVYTSPFAPEGRASMGSIYFLLEGEDISHFHQIDCEELWYFHEGCPLKITWIMNGTVRETILGTGEGQAPMAVMPGGAVFAAENLDPDSFCFLSCATTPMFSYEGFRLVDRAELRDLVPSEYERLKHLAFPGQDGSKTDAGPAAGYTGRQR